MADLGTHATSVHGTTSANVEDTITISQVCAAIEVVNRDGADEVFYTVNGVALTAVPQNGAEVLPKQAGTAQTYLIPEESRANPTVVRLRSVAATKVSVFRR